MKKLLTHELTIGNVYQQLSNIYNPFRYRVTDRIGMKVYGRRINADGDMHPQIELENDVWWAYEIVMPATEPDGGVSIPDARSANRGAILGDACDAVTVDRAATHGDLEDSFGTLAAVWSSRLGVTVTPSQVCLMLVDLKVTRAWSNPGHRDSFVDIAGYGACAGELADGT